MADISSSDTLVGLISKENPRSLSPWGIKYLRKNEEDERCLIPAGEFEEGDQYHHGYYDYFKGRSSINLPNYTVSQKKDLGLLETRFMTNSNFVFDKIGVLGMSPNSKFLTYLLSNTLPSPSEVMFTLEISQKAGKTRDSVVVEDTHIFDGSKITLNGFDKTRIDEKTIHWKKADKGSPSRWGFKTVLLEDSTRKKDFVGTACLRLDLPYLALLSVQEANNFTRLYNNRICGTDDPCPTSFKISGVPDFTITINDENSDTTSKKVVTFKPEEFIYEDEGKWQYLISSSHMD